MFALGVNLFTLYFPVIVMYWVLYFKNFRIEKRILFQYGLVFFSILLLFIIGNQRMTLENTWQVFIAFNLTLITSVLAIHKNKVKLSSFLIVSYILGLGVVPLITAGYSYFFNEGNYGRGLVFNPVTGSTTNSPLVSNNLALLTSMLIYFLFKINNVLLKTLVLACVGSLAFLGVFLGGRTYFIIISLAFLYQLLFGKHYKKIKTLLTIIFLLMIFVLLFWEQATFLQEKINYLGNRFEAGITSGDVRFFLIADGFNQLLIHPLGGYEVDRSISSVRWFHNIFIDMGRLGGWIPVFLLVAFVVYVLLRSSTRFFVMRDTNRFFLMLFFLSFLLLQQDIGIEGDYRVLIVMVLTGLLLIRHKKPFKIADLDHKT